jgi:cysteinyl-tRNA synthetase
LRSPLERADAWDAPDGPDPGGELGEQLETAGRLFHEAMDDDFNSAKAIGHLFDLSRQVNRALDDGLGSAARVAARRLLDLGAVLGLFWKAPAGEAWSPEILRLVEARETARKARNWAEADRLRGELLGLGVVVEDSPGGAKIKRR